MALYLGKSGLFVQRTVVERDPNACIASGNDNEAPVVAQRRRPRHPGAQPGFLYDRGVIAARRRNDVVEAMRGHDFARDVDEHCGIVAGNLYPFVEQQDVAASTDDDGTRPECVGKRLCPKDLRIGRGRVNLQHGCGPMTDCVDHQTVFFAIGR